jgi:daunorubicin resistance ABC transporter ATP-binding subunit
VTAPAVEVLGLQKTYADQVALRGLDFAASSGSVLGVLGPNGAGKTTLIRILATLTRPSAGSARICGHEVSAEPGEVRRLIGLTGQYASVDARLTGRENLRLIGELVDLPRRAARVRADELLAWVGLSGDGDRLVGRYSGGMRRRLDLAASLVARPAVVFLDEPSTGLDPAARRALWEAVAALGDLGTTVVLTSQYLEEIDALADTVLVIDHGHAIAHGSPTSLKQRVGGRRLRVTLVEPGDGVVGVQQTAERLGLPVEVADRSVVVAVEDAQQAADVLAALSSAGAEIDEAHLALPSLDEVFLALTGSER